MRLKIKVEQKHIDAGERGNAWSCALALAVKDTKIPGKMIDGASVRVRSSSFIVDGRRVRFRMPVRAARAVRAFDKLGRHAITPFSFFAVIEDGAI